MKNRVTTFLFAAVILVATSLTAQSTARAYSFKTAPTRTPARTTNTILRNMGAGVAQAASSIGYTEGSRSVGTTVPSDTSAYFYIYGNLNALGGLAWKYKVDSVARYAMTAFENVLDHKRTTASDTVVLPTATYTLQGREFTIKNSSVNTLFIRGGSIAEYIDTVRVYSLPTKASVTLIATGLAAPSGTVVATNKLNPSWIIK